LHRRAARSARREVLRFGHAGLTTLRRTHAGIRRFVVVAREGRGVAFPVADDRLAIARRLLRDGHADSRVAHTANARRTRAMGALRVQTRAIARDLAPEHRRSGRRLGTARARARARTRSGGPRASLGIAAAIDR